MKEEIRKIENEELENVTGGCGSRYSDKTYRDLNIGLIDYNSQNKKNHPLITTDLNDCDLGAAYCSDKHYCKYCHWSTMHPGGTLWWCGRRSQENDPVRS